MRRVPFALPFILLAIGLIGYQTLDGNKGKAFALTVGNNDKEFAITDKSTSYCMIQHTGNDQPVVQLDNNPFNIIPLTGTIHEAQELLPVAANGDNDALENAIGILYKLKLEQPGNAPIVSLLGAAFGIKAGQSWNPFDMMKFGFASFDCIDTALEIAPNDMEVRLNRAITNWKSPSWLGRRDAAIQDILVLDKLFRETPTQRVAQAMLIFEFYDILNEHANDVGDWNEGKALAKEYAQ